MMDLCLSTLIDLPKMIIKVWDNHMLGFDKIILDSNSQSPEKMMILKEFGNDLMMILF